MAKSKVTDMGRIFVGGRCNNKCKFCNLLKTGHFDKNFSTEEINNQIEQAKKDGFKKVTFRGGEITIRDDIAEILKLCNTLSLDVEIETNGRMFAYKEFCEKISQFKIKEYHIKILSDSETQIRNSLKQTINGIKNLLALGQKIIAIIVINSYSIKDLRKRIAFINKIGIKDIKIIYPENKRGFEPLYTSLIPKIRDAAYRIDSVKKDIENFNIKLHRNELPYYYEKPHNLFSIRDKIEYEKIIFEGKKKISIIIPTANRSSYLKKTLEALYKQNYAKDEYEIIIVDDNSKDDTAEVIKNSNPTCNIKHIFWGRENDFIPGAPMNRAGPLRNIGADYSSGDYIIFIDTDIVTNPEFINEHIRSHKDFDVVVGPSIREKENIDVRENFFQLCNDRINNFPVPWTLAHEGNISITRETWGEYGVFSDDFVYWAVEGDDLAFRWFDNGLKFGLNRDAWGIHLNHPSETVDKETFAKGIAYNGEILYKRNLDIGIFNRYFVQDEVQVLNGNLNHCISQITDSNEFPYVERLTNCVELQRCKNFRLCQSRPDLIKRIINIDTEKKIFFRNDDAGIIDESLERLIRLFKKHNQPLNLAVIPKISDSDFIEWIEKLDNPNSVIEMHQHGYQHINNGTPSAPFEIGGDQSFEEQLNYIKKGQDKLTKLMGDKLASVYTPPFHGFNEETIHCLEKIGIKIFSASKDKKINSSSVTDFSISIDPIDWETTDRYEEKTWTRLLEEFVSTLENEETIGIGLHHELITEYGFKNIENLLELIAMNEKLKVFKISDLID